MLEIKKVSKIYETDGFKQKALDEVSINFRRSEFASILGVSGSGKTTLLNIIGGLDQYTSGDLIINETSTKQYSDRDWDTYRNHRVGFVFQSYNLITHQSVLSNVELALTLSGVSKTERRKRAKDALKKVGLEEHMNKKPNQLSGGQMQRVAIARSLVNNPDILLADEPTGALDSETSNEVMDILKVIAKDKLVIMVTHNSELAEEYSTRIIKLKDGHIIDDSNPYDGKEDKKQSIEEEKTKIKKTSMSLFTALSLSLNNLMTKKGRTILTAFAGSIGIIGIALILSLSNGVQEYIDRVQKETLSSYPLSIELSTIDMSSMMQISSNEEVVCNSNTICTTDDISNSRELQMASSVITNNLNNFKSYLDGNGGNINDYVTDIQYSYNLDLQIYSQNTEDGIVKVNPNTLSLSSDVDEQSDGNNPLASMMGSSSSVFSELLNNEELLNSQYDVLSGRLPESYNEVVLVVNEDNTLPLSLMYSLDIENRAELTEIIEKATNGEEVSLDSIEYSYEELVGTTYKLVLNTDYYQKSDGIWVDKSTDINYMKDLIENGVNITIVGVLKVSDDAVSATSGFVGYTHELTEYVINQTSKAEIAIEQLANEEINVFTGMNFDGLVTTLENNLETLGVADLDNPTTINIYPKDFDSKESIKDIIADYNKEQESLGNVDNIIDYTDLLGVLLSSITTIVNVISYILIAFVAISLVVSSIMIAIITYISVLERTKEIGILRAIGASKKDVSRVFTAETIIEGLIAGFMGVGLSLLLIIPINAIVNSVVGIAGIASLPLVYAGVLILISVLLTVIAGFIPSRMASKKNPVEALRSE